VTEFILGHIILSIGGYGFYLVTQMCCKFLFKGSGSLEFSKNDMTRLKGMAILCMLCLHLFCRKIVNGLYVTAPTWHGIPLIYYLGLFSDVCVPIYCFASGYGLFITLSKQQGLGMKKNIARIFKLLTNYWIILILFVLLGLLIGKEGYPGSPTNFVMNFFVLSDSYNSAWWFLQTYIILVLIAPFLFKWVKKTNSYVVIMLSGIFYLITYVQRFKQVIDLNHHAGLGMLMNAIVLFGTSQLPFIVGAVFAKEKIYSKIYNRFYKMPFKNTISLLIIILMMVIHGVFQSLIIAPLTATIFIVLFNLMNKKISVQKLFDFLGKHSTNIWLTHMFFYMIFFPKLVFAPRLPILIYIWLIVLCLISSFIINAIYKPILNLIDRKMSVPSYKQKVVG
jgi:surface polysaccharide O-acyltransferase-like enzyme